MITLAKLEIDHLYLGGQPPISVVGFDSKDSPMNLKGQVVSPVVNCGHLSFLT